LYIWLCHVPGAHAQQADTLYANREQLADARAAARLWEADLRDNASPFDAAWKLSRVSYWLGTHGEQTERRGFLERGIETGRRASAISPDAPEGHFWTAANMGALAESFGLRAGLRYRAPIKHELQTVLRLSPSFMQGSADRALGRWYFKVPGLFGGSHRRAIEHLRASLTYNPRSTVSLFFLAEVLADDERIAEARALLQQVLDAPLDPDWAPEDRDYKTRAAALLAKLK
jgi:tetratricopeptide (TPR) repeat protein